MTIFIPNNWLPAKLTNQTTLNREIVTKLPKPLLLRELSILKLFSMPLRLILKKLLVHKVLLPNFPRDSRMDKTLEMNNVLLSKKKMPG